MALDKDLLVIMILCFVTSILVGVVVSEFISEGKISAFEQDYGERLDGLKESTEDNSDAVRDSNEAVLDQLKKLRDSVDSQEPVVIEQPEPRVAEVSASGIDAKDMADLIRDVISTLEASNDDNFDRYFDSIDDLVDEVQDNSDKGLSQSQIREIIDSLSDLLSDSNNASNEQMAMLIESQYQQIGALMDYLNSSNARGVDELSLMVGLLENFSQMADNARSEDSEMFLEMLEQISEQSELTINSLSDLLSESNNYSNEQIAMFMESFENQSNYHYWQMFNFLGYLNSTLESDSENLLIAMAMLEQLSEQSQSAIDSLSDIISESNNASNAQIALLIETVATQNQENYLLMEDLLEYLNSSDARDAEELAMIVDLVENFSQSTNEAYQSNNELVQMLLEQMNNQSQMNQENIDDLYVLIEYMVLQNQYNYEESIELLNELIEALENLEITVEAYFDIVIPPGGGISG